MAVVSFVYADWLGVYPAFTTTVSEPLATSYFGLACLSLDNTDCSPVQDIAARTSLLYMATAHIAQLFSGSAGNPANGLVGRVSSATEGSVSVSTEFANKSASAAWWLQTPWGAMWWQLTAPYRTARYIPGPRPYLGVRPGYGRGGYGW